MDIIDIEILEDGTITMKTSAVSDANHISADKLLVEVEKLAGGKTAKGKNPEAKRHIHAEAKTHSH